MYRAKDSAVKSAVRKLLYNEVTKNWQGSGVRNILTLSNSNFELETMFLNHYLCKITCLEYDKVTFNRAKRNKPPMVNMLYGDLFKFNNTGFAYDFIWMDLCNSYYEGLLNKVTKFISGTIMHHNSTFAVTFCKGRGFLADSVINEYYPHFKDAGIGQYLTQFFNRTPKEIKIVDYKCFDISVSATPMSLIIFKF